MAYGNLRVLDTLISSNLTVQEFGEENAFDAINQALIAHNNELQEVLSLFCDITSERMYAFGTTDSMEMRRVDEFGAVDTQKVRGGQTLGLPLYLHQVAVGWTRKAFQQITAARLAAQFTAANDADIRNINREIRRALFKPTNNLLYIDRLTDQVNLELRALLNADGQEPPLGPNGETFDGSTHTHYLGSATLTTTHIDNILDTVREHGVLGDLVLFIARGNESAFRLLTGFEPYTDPRIIPALADSRADGTLDMVNVNNRAIGIYGGAEVWVKPWVPTNYQAVLDINATEKPLGLRTPSGSLAAGAGALNIAAEHEHYPLRANWMEREFGVSALNRHRAAVGQSNNATYTIPASLA